MSESTPTLSFECPRCATATEGRFYGPCDSCSAELRATYMPEAKDIEAPEYVPKMNVTPNAVATKE
ncbi:MAG: hypothetical protein ACRBK7_26135 [Acidimicrobiales bacterium]